MTDLKKLIRDGNVIIGTDMVLKKLRKGELAQVFVSQNCPAKVLTQLKHYSSIVAFELHETAYTNKELGVLCKKPFSISVLGIPKA